MGIKIIDMTTTTADGTEIIPTSKAAAPRSVTALSLKNYVVDAIEAIAAGTAPTGADSVFVLQGGALKPVDIDLIAQHAIDTIWAKVDATPVGANLVPLKASGVEKTMTVTNLAEAIRGLIEATILDVSNLSSGAGAIAVTDYMLVTQGTTGKRIQISDLSTLIYASLVTHVTGKAALSDPAVGTDVLYVVRSGVAYKVTLTQIATFVGVASSLTGSGTTDFLAKFASSSSLTSGPSIVSDNFSAGDNTGLPTTLAVRTELSTVIYDQADIGAALVGTDTILVDDGAAGTTQRKAALSRVKTYLEGAGLAAYKTLWVPAKDMTPSTTAGCAALATVEYTTTNDMNHAVLAFAGDTADENAEFDVVMPEGWDLGTIKVKLYWSNGHADSNVGEYVGFYVAAGARSNDDALDAANGTEVLMADQLLADDDMHVSAASAAMTVGGTPALGDLIHFKLRRDYDYTGGGTAMDVDARVFGVLIQYLENVVPAAW